MIIINFSGGLGNQMFQYALFKKFQLLGREVKADITFYDETKAHNGFEIERVFNITIPKATPNEINKLKDTSLFLKKYRRMFKIFWKSTDKEQLSFDFDKSIFKLTNAYINGYWQSERFFEDIPHIIREEFIFKEINEQNNILLQDIIHSNAVSVHIRRGDYVTDEAVKKLLGGICDINYYNKAIELIKQKAKHPIFFVFSDDLNWAKANLALPAGTKFVNINKGENCYQDMFLMSFCKHHIIANSSFSWWGAWLDNNPEKIVIAPPRWVNNQRKFNRLDSPDIIPSSWIRIKQQEREKVSNI